MIPMLVVPTLTRHDLLDRMLRSVDCLVGQLVVIDNSGRGVAVPDGPWEDATVLRMPSNLGVAGSWNLAVRMAHRHPYVTVCSDDMWWPSGALAGLAEVASAETLVVSATWPHWQAFALGMGIVRAVGLFDEGYYPAYFEDTDYERRMLRAGLKWQHGPATNHDNASTLNTPELGFGNRNGHSFEQNKALFEQDRQCGFDPYRWRDQAW